MSATDGMGRRNSIVLWVARRRNVLLPMTSPRTIAATAAISSPRNQARTVCQTASQKPAEPCCSPSYSRTALAGGRRATVAR